jgi:hypothetical protein
MTAWNNDRPSIPVFSTQYGPQAITEVKEGEMFRLAGWSRPEKGFVWTDGRKVLLNLGCLPGSIQTIQLSCMPFVAPNLTVQRVTLSVGEQRVGYYFVDSPTVLRCTVEGQGAEKPVVLELSLPDATIPFLVTGSDDLRELGLAVQSLDVVPFPDRAKWKRPLYFSRKYLMQCLRVIKGL